MDTGFEQEYLAELTEIRETPEFHFATIGAVYSDGVSLIFDGQDTATDKHYRVNTSVSFTAGDRVKIFADSGTYVVEYVVGEPQIGGGVITSLPSSGTELTAGAEYIVSASVGAYQFRFPASGDVYVRFTKSQYGSTTFYSGTRYIGGAPTFVNGRTYELMSRDRIVAWGEVVS